MNLSNVVVAIISVIITTAVISAVISIASEDRWQKACKLLDIKIEWHRYVGDGIVKDWVEMIDLRDGDVRKVEVK